MTDQALAEQALVEEATKKSGLIWVRGSGVPSLDPQDQDRAQSQAQDQSQGPGREAPTRALWHVWHDGAVYVVGDGPGEQPLPGLVDGREAVVTVRSKDKGGRLVSWTAAVAELAPGSEEWTVAVGELKGKRLNAPDGEAMTERWARECRVVRLAPTGSTSPSPTGSLAAVPVRTSATTRLPVPAGLPRLLFRRLRRSG
ncbi:hypothetical protein [Streptomyces ortus]|uniref:Uncharacterized protein n=1 Tax=Streptomyces ortus TaxID=2867268 RepID=A0ABT3V2U9_9ACTN|nr:hypothetical protein [Streptomyces ortus]MCX4234282.1 hypothetical protein [Streptomyces ortus]